MFYSAWDYQCGRFLETGINSKTKEECVNAVLEYLMSDSEEDKIDFSNWSLEEKINFIYCAEIDIEELEDEI